MARKMKDSGIEWIGEIPEGWNVGKVSYFFDIQLGKMLQPIAHKEDDTLEYYLCAANLGGNCLKTDNLKQMWFSKSEKSKYEVRKGDLLVVEGGDVASCDIVKEDANGLCIQNAIHRVRNRSGFDERILRYYLMVAKSVGYIDLICNKATIAHFTKEKLASMPMPAIPIEEQHVIADFLDLKCERINAAIEKTKASIEEYKKLKQAIITQAVTKGIRPNRPMKDSGVEWIGEIPEDWNIFRIANLYDERNENGNEDLPILTVSINTGISDHEVAEEEQIRVFIRSEDKSKYKRVYVGDLAYNMMRAWQGAFGAVRVDGMVSPAYVIAKPKETVRIESRYMEALLRTSAAVEEMHRYSKGITDFRLRLYWPEFKNIKVCVPSASEQIEIANFIDSKKEEIDRLITVKEKIVTELESYKKSLIYEYVTGKKEVSA